MKFELNLEVSEELAETFKRIMSESTGFTLFTVDNEKTNIVTNRMSVVNIAESIIHLFQSKPEIALMVSYLMGLMNNSVPEPEPEPEPEANPWVILEDLCIQS